ncbi:MAG TPA: protein translocase subunit SecD [Candidatus Cloacimonetes bacterium]|nr:protein translocase subunit SecD [Candidatus Cloacimonadota bacterium]HEX37640.1 protein translocase subunit SecD [Candidatus Cloacimonadota bacterium]
MKKNWFRTIVIIVVFLITIYYLLPLIAKNNYAIVNMKVYDQDSTLIYEINEHEYKMGSKLFGTDFDEQIAMADINDSIFVSGKLPDYMLRSVEGDIDFTQDQLIQAEVVEKTSKVELPSWFSKKELKLGLDLQGGMHLVLEVDTEDLSTDATTNAVNSAQKIITNRIDQFGVAEPTIQKIGSKRILVQLPGLRDAGRAKELIGKTALLEFRLVANNQDIGSAVEAIDEYLKANYDKYAYLKEIEQEQTSAVEETLLSEEPDSTADSTAIEPEETSRDHLFSSLVSVYGQRLIVRKENLDLFKKIIELPEIKEVMPEGVIILLGKSDEKNFPGARPVYFLYDTVELTGASLKSADVRIGQGMDPKIANKPYVSLQLDNEGSRIFANVTGNHINEQLAIVLDDVVQTAPVINDKIRDGNAMITGIPDMEEAKDLAIVLNAGNLPAPVNIIEERTVGPTLGSDSIDAGFKAALIGLVLVVIFMVIYYKLSGFIADIALFGNVLIILAVLTMLNASLTMPGIAGIILTIGMAVDANVLIFERIREELRSGKTVRTAIDNGYKRAVITIADANITTLITAVVLYQFGTGAIRGFAVTLSVGILASMFTAIVVTKAIFDGVITRKPRKSLSI